MQYKEAVKAVKDGSRAMAGNGFVGKCTKMVVLFGEDRIILDNGEKTYHHPIKEVHLW